MNKFLETYPVRSLFDVQSIRNIEQQLFALSDSFDIMQQAADALYKRVLQRWPKAQRFIVLVGGGNNGGDGLLLAILLQEAGYTVQVLDCVSRTRQGDAQKAYQRAQESGVTFSLFRKSATVLREELMPENMVLVDALLGIGARLPLNNAYIECVQWVNDIKSRGANVVSVDIPTGVDSDTGYANEVVMADMTVSMIQPKLGNVLGRGAIATGDLVNESLGATGLLPSAKGSSSSNALWLDVERLENNTPCSRPKDSHKGMFGHVLVVGGDCGFGGAAIMSSEAASKAGAGTVALLTRADHVVASLSRNPNVMALAFDHEQAELLAMRNNTVLVIGPGLGRSAWGKTLFDAWIAVAIRHSSPLVLDADALYWLSQTDDVLLPELSVLTPHVGEASRLLGWSIERIQQNPIAAATAIAKQYRCTVVLKGTTSIVANEMGELYVTGRAQSVLAKGGSGDVLSGMLGACLAYYKKPITAAVLCVAWHNHAAGRSAEALGEHRAQPFDLLNYVG